MERPEDLRDAQMQTHIAAAPDRRWLTEAVKEMELGTPLRELSNRLIRSIAQIGEAAQQRHQCRLAAHSGLSNKFLM